MKRAEPSEPDREQPAEGQGPRRAPTRVHPSGRLTFRSSVRVEASPDHRVVVAGDESLPWQDIVPAAWPGPIELEIGCGKGAFLAAAATSRPETYFVGCEAGVEYARYCADRVQGLENVWLVADDARLFLADSVPDRSLARIHVYHPDPWPKRRHRKRRLFDAAFARDVARKLTLDGQLLVGTDNTRYFGEILAVLGAEATLRRDLEREASYGDEVPGLAFGPTNFAQKYVHEGRERHRAIYRLTERDAPRRTQSATNTDTRDGWQRLCSIDEVPAGLSRHVVGDLEVCVVRDGDSLHALRDSCPHRGAELSAGLLEGAELVCPRHGWRYSVTSGECSTLPGSAPALCFAVRVEDRDVFVQVPPFRGSEAQR